MTKYAPTFEGRAAAAADMAATGTTMGRRPTGPKGPMVQPGVRGGPRSQPIYNRRKSGTPVYGAGPRGPKRGYSPVVDVQDPRMGPRGPKTGVFNPVVDPPRPMGPRGPRGYGPNDGGPRPMGPLTTPVNVTGMPVGGPKTGVRPYDGKPANPRVTYNPRGVAPYDDTPTATRTPSGSGKTKFPLDSNGNYIIPPGTVNSVSFSRPAPPQQVGLSAPQQPVGGPPGKLPGTVGGAPISQQGASDLQGLNQMIAARGAISPMNMGPSPSFKKGGAVKFKAMRGGGLARKGVGMALAKGGLARRAGGCAKRGVGRGKIT